LQTFEDALIAPAEELQSLMNFIVVGGGDQPVLNLWALCRDEKIYSQKIILTKISQN
jgi:hypothetical protein